MSALAPFHVRSFRYQWPADLAASWAFEMETLILGWYILAVTGSVEQLVMLGALVWIGSLFSPLFALAGDRLGIRALLCITRALYALLAIVLMGLTLSDQLAPWHVFLIATVIGLVRPSDNLLRNVLIGQTIRPEALMAALGVSRTTTDTARVMGALAGTAGVALVGMGTAYVAVTLLYCTSFVLSLGVAGSSPRARSGSAGVEAQSLGTVMRDMKQAVSYVWHKPDLLSAFSIALLVNLLAYPFVLGLLPYVAMDVYGIGQAGLGYLAGAFALGALAGSLGVWTNRLPLRAGRFMLANAAAWFVCILLFGQTQSVSAGVALLFVTGLVQSFCLVPLAAVMLRSSSDAMRGRVMGMRMLAIWGLPLGLLASGPLIAHLGYPATTVLYAGLGLVLIVAIGYRWRGALWQRSAAANAHL